MTNEASDSWAHRTSQLGKPITTDSAVVAFPKSALLLHYWLFQLIFIPRGCIRPAWHSYRLFLTINPRWEGVRSFAADTAMGHRNRTMPAPNHEKDVIVCLQILCTESRSHTALLERVKAKVKGWWISFNLLSLPRPCKWNMAWQDWQRCKNLQVSPSLHSLHARYQVIATYFSVNDVTPPSRWQYYIPLRINIGHSCTSLHIPSLSK